MRKKQFYSAAHLMVGQTTYDVKSRAFTVVKQNDYFGIFFFQKLLRIKIKILVIFFVSEIIFLVYCQLLIDIIKWLLSNSYISMYCFYRLTWIPNWVMLVTNWSSLTSLQCGVGHVKWFHPNWMNWLMNYQTSSYSR